jgi:hypothetical protein
MEWIQVDSKAYDKTMKEDKENKEPGYKDGEDKDQLEQKQEEESGEQETTNQVF